MKKYQILINYGEVGNEIHGNIFRVFWEITKSGDKATLIINQLKK